MTLMPGDEIHYVALLDRGHDFIHTIPLEQVLVVPAGDQVEHVSADVRVKVTYKAEAK